MHISHPSHLKQVFYFSSCQPPKPNQTHAFPSFLPSPKALGSRERENLSVLKGIPVIPLRSTLQNAKEEAAHVTPHPSLTTRRRCLPSFHNCSDPFQGFNKESYPPFEKSLSKRVFHFCLLPPLSSLIRPSTGIRDFPFPPYFLLTCLFKLTPFHPPFSVFLVPSFLPSRVCSSGFSSPILVSLLGIKAPSLELKRETHSKTAFTIGVTLLKMQNPSVEICIQIIFGGLVFSVIWSSCCTALYPPDIQSLYEVRSHLLQQRDAIPGWFDSSTSPCNWTGIICEGFIVHELDLSCNILPLSIPFPSEIGYLRNLRSLNLSHCALTGQIPMSLWGLSSLEILDLSDNSFTGTLPPEVSRLRNLRRLVLDDNNFSGSLPSSIGLLEELVELSVRGNGFSGSLPPEIGNLSKLESLDISLNDFSGKLPSTLGNLLQLLCMDASQNRFSGPIFSEIGNLLGMHIIDLSMNSLSGPIPPTIGKLVSLHSLNLNNNNLNGALPPALGNLTALEVLNLQSCRFSGTIPREISRLANLTLLNIAHNIFEGGLPPDLGNLKSLTFFLASNSGLSGRIPGELSGCKDLQVLDLSFNSLSGPLPDDLARLESIQSLMLGSNKLSGSIPRWMLSSWRQVASIMLSKNLFTGSLPPLSLPNLSLFDASSNMLSGELSSEICNSAKSLSTLLLSDNSFTGTIEGTFRSCFSLADLVLSGNNLSGDVPGYLGRELKQLVNIELSKNKFSGRIPDELWDSDTLMEVSLADNELTGELSEAVGKALSLQRLQLDNNHLEGRIPNSIGELRNLTNLSLHGNMLIGEIPLELFNCTRLVSLDLGGNRLKGQIPKSIHNLKLLDNLVLSGNHLSGPIPEEICLGGFQKVPLPDSEFTQHYGKLDLSENQFSGSIPSTIGQCTVLTQLLLQKNNLSGNVPSMSALLNLTSVDLSFNHLSGNALPEFASLENLQGLILSHNNLTGSIPASLMLPSLTKLDLSWNQFEGALPPWLFRMSRLISIDVGANSFSGTFPCDTTGTTSLLFLNASNNRLSGTLCSSLSNLKMLSVLDLHNNDLGGSLPSTLPNLAYLTYLDLSRNKFEDSVPRNLCDAHGLSFIDFSSNRFSGYVPETCSSIASPAEALPVLISSPRSRGLSKSSVWGMVICACFIFIAFLMILLGKKMLSHQKVALVEEGNSKLAESADSSDELLGKKSKEPLSINIATFQHSLTRIHPSDILSATDNFSKTYVIGDGGFGTVYRAALPQGRVMAVKRLNLHGSDREFLAEMETIGKVRHENLVPLYGYCVFGEERFLIYEYMENGSLDVWLRNRADAVEVLDWPTRLNICLGSAKGIAFLHHGFVPHIIHRDIKSSNILLDREFEAKVSDFGLARIISACESHVSTVLAGTFGYIPPEYGQSMTATTKGDVYSFGVVMLELVTGRAPTGQADLEGGNLVGWVRQMAAKRREEEVLDASMRNWKRQMLRVLGVAQTCTSDDPRRRPTMLQVVKQLGEIKAQPYSSLG